MYKLLIYILPFFGFSQIFPGALGAGANLDFSTECPTPTIYRVTNLNDSGAGSLRDAIHQTGLGQEKSCRVVVFEVAGKITLLSRIQCYNSNIWIAGQTAPFPGITVTGNFSGDTFIEMGESTQNYTNHIVQYLKIRPEFQSTDQDAITFRNVDGVMVDHCSFSWGADEITSSSFASDNVTYQYCVFGEGKTGQIMGNSSTPSAAGTAFSNIRNFYYNTSHRHPNANTDGRFDIINVVVYNWDRRMTRTIGGIQLNHFDNYYLRNNQDVYSGNVFMVLDGTSSPGSIQIYTERNRMLPGVLTSDSGDNWTNWRSFNTWSHNGTNYSSGSPINPVEADFRVYTPFAVLGPAFTPYTAEESYAQIGNWGANVLLTETGTTTSQRDAIDTKYITNASNNIDDDYVWDLDASLIRADLITKQHYIDFLADTTTGSHAGSRDTDNDGMPDTWETSRFGNLTNSTGSNDYDSNGVTDIFDFTNLASNQASTDASDKRKSLFGVLN